MSESKESKIMNLVRANYPALAGIAWELLYNQPERIPNCALTAVIAGGGVGIADRGIQGYTPAPVVMELPYDEVESACVWFNEHVLRHDKRAAYEIVLSSVSGN